MRAAELLPAKTPRRRAGTWRGTAKAAFAGRAAGSSPRAAHCRCGAAAPKAETDDRGGPVCTILECRSCGRLIGGLTPDDALALWNAAMSGPPK